MIQRRNPAYPGWWRNSIFASNVCGEKETARSIRELSPCSEEVLAFLREGIEQQRALSPKKDVSAVAAGL
jgi:hypothetical protein